MLENQRCTTSSERFLNGPALARSPACSAELIRTTQEVARRLQELVVRATRPP